MDFRSIIRSSKTYLIALILASAVILYTASVGYKQVKRLQESANLVAHTFEVERVIVELFSNFTAIETRQLKFALDDGLTEIPAIHLNQVDVSLQKLKKLVKDHPLQSERAKTIEKFRDSLFVISTMVPDTVGDPKAVQEFLDKRLAGITGVVNRVRLVKNTMLIEEKKLLTARKEVYASRTFLTPLLSLLVALFSLAVFVMAFIRIYKHKQLIESVNNKLLEQNQKLQETETFLKGVYRGSNNVISHLIPVFNEDGQIKDFTFLYTSEIVEEVTGDQQDQIIGKKLSNAFPMAMENGLFEDMITCYVTGATQEHDALYSFGGKNKYIHNSIVKSGKGVTNTGWDTTSVKDAERNLKDLNDRLNFQNTIFKDAESISDIGSYIWYLDNGKATISDNFYRILGYEPNSFELSFDKYREFVHPDDLEIYTKLGNETQRDGTSLITDYRIVSKQGAIKHLHITARYAKKDNRPVSIGVIQDVTERVVNDRKLIESNERLKQSNAELEAFNRVASHDLQEPLRKIQMFISRIQEKESTSLSENSKYFFEKIKNAADRMQVLIQNLLTYSRIDRKQDDFESLDLNVILQKVKEELTAGFNESGAVLFAQKLPIIKGIAFEMEQVFTNLIGNSLKYKSIVEVPKITIQAEKVNRSQISESFIKIAHYYHKISIKDNGIGFSPEYADKIFEVFQRLHQKSEYSGTGIGLSICKKIMENHKGHIHAVGTLGQGAVFVLYLPVIQ